MKILIPEEFLFTFCLFNSLYNTFYLHNGSLELEI